MSLEVYNQTMSSLLKQQQALAKLREELEGREGRKRGKEELGMSAVWSLGQEL